MGKYNPVEKYLAGVLSGSPKLKNIVKKLYSSFNYLLYKRSYSFKSECKIDNLLSDEGNESFFGYYDKSPSNTNAGLIIFHETDGIVSHFPPDPEKVLNIMLYDTEKSVYRKISTTSAFNWQQGSRLQWLNNEQFVFNVFDDHKFMSKIHDINGNFVKALSFPIYDCYNDEFALSLNFSRLNKLDTHYGYKNISSCDLSEIRNDGIFYIDLLSNERKLLISIEKVISLHYNDTMNNAEHCFNHIMISPDGKHFIFIHRWYQSGKRYDSLILSDIEGTEIKVLADNGMVSHCCWKDENTVVGFLKNNDNISTYYSIDTITGVLTEVSGVMKRFGDGHPSISSGKILFDSYPDRSRMQHLYLNDLETNIITELGEFLSPLRYFGETRCDLHPKWDCTGSSIFFDSAHEGKRTLYRIKL